MYGPQLETTMGARAVTPGYSPPEQYGQGTTDPRTDIYALAATLYTLLTARLPPESVQRYGADDLVLPHQVDNSISPVVSAAVGRAMALNPSQRFQSVAEMRAVLWPDVTVRAAQPAPGASAWLRAIQPGWIVGGAALLLLCLALGGTATVGGALALPFLFGTATPRLTPVPTTGKVLFQDNFSDPRGGWAVGSDKGGQRLFENGAYVIRVTQKDWQTWSTASAETLTNLHAEVTVTSTGLAADEGFGLVCDYVDTTHYYFLGITPDGYYAIIKTRGQADTVMTDPNGKWIQSMNFAVKAASYRLGVDCGSDGRLTLYADGRELASVHDATFTSGQLGLFVRSFDQAPAEVRFDDLIVTALH
jgi:hypothetical protein